ncbi:MAG: hypothetical protein K9J25_04110 [Bacteroidales bacterium]|nr:hypothetical protein [Bacteroidales bacterium]
MTAQATDIIIYRGEKSRLCNNPLEQLWKFEKFERPDFNLRSTGNWRGYIATWEIKYDNLYLVGIKEDDPEFPRELIDFFPETRGKPVKAWWYTGKLRIVRGKIVNYIHGGYGSSYEKEIYLIVRSGKVKDRHIKNFKEEDFIVKKTRKEKKREEKVQKYVRELFRYTFTNKQQGKPPRRPKIKMAKKPGPSIKDCRKVKKFLAGHPEFFIDHMSGEYPLSNELIQRYKDLWKWDLLSDNTNLKWSDRLIEKYEDRWSWGEEGMYSPNIRYNEQISWTTDLIYKFRNRIDQEDLAQSTDLLIKYPDVLDLITNKLYWEYISSNEHLPWTSAMIEKYEDYIDFELLSGNRSVPWTEELIAKYASRFDFKRYEEGNYEPWANKKEDHRYKEENKGILAPTWSFSDDEYKLKYTKKELAQVLADPDWEIISCDRCVPWSEELIDKYIDKWEWGHNIRRMGTGFCYSSHPPGMEYEEVHNGLSSNPDLPWSVKFIKKYSGKINWNHLTNNEGLPWSLYFINKFRKKWSWRELRWNEGLWKKVFYPCLDDRVIGEIMEKIRDYAD